MGRRIGRKLAVQLLYQLEMTGGDIDQAVAAYAHTYAPEDFAALEFAAAMVRGAWEHREEIDCCIANTAQNWSLQRIAPVERGILRLAVYELLYCPDIPYKVTMNEAVELGKTYGSEKSGAFINGVLDNLFDRNPDLHARRP